MWVLLSARLRTWLFLAVALPLARLGLHRIACAVQRRNPDGAAGATLQRADRLLSSAAQRKRRRA